MVNQNQFPKRPIRKKRRKQEKKFGNNNRKKLLIVFIVLLIFICVLIGRLLYINLSSSDTYARIVMAQMDYDSKSIPSVSYTHLHFGESLCVSNELVAEKGRITIEEGLAWMILSRD